MKLFKSADNISEALTFLSVVGSSSLILRAMASSRVMTLVVTLLFVITAGIYLLRLSLLSDVLILASAVLLARLDLTRAGALPPPLPSMYLLAFVVFAGIGIGHLLPNPTAGWFAEVLISA